MRIRGVLIALLCLALLPALAAHFRAAAQAGQGGSDQAQSRGRGPDSRWDNDSFFDAIFHEPLFKGHSEGFRAGFRAGYEDGRMDMEDGMQQHPGYRYLNPDHYRAQFGDRDTYVAEYRAGYEQGYRRGYAVEA